MAKETGLWDDSALVNAFDNAMIKYKKMHNAARQESVTEREKVTTGTNESEFVPTDETSSNLEVDENNNNISDRATENYMSSYTPGAVNELPPIQENHLGRESHPPEFYAHPSSNPSMPEASQGYTNARGVEYNKLLREYYELEKKRLQLLQQLQHAHSWNYQPSGEGSVSCVPWNTCSCTSHANQLPVHHDSNDGLHSSCYPYTCHCLAASWSLVPACALGSQCVAKSGGHSTAPPCKMDPVMLSSVADENVVKTAFGAAESVISSMKRPVTPDVCEGESKAKESENNGSGTEISVVLNAWYSAGFYTGRYLLEQSIAEARP